MTNGLAARWPDTGGVAGPAERSQEAPESLTNARGFRRRCPHDAIQAERTAVDEARYAFHRSVIGNLHEAVPVSKHLEQSDLCRAQPLVSALGAGRAADEPDDAWTARRSTRNSDRFAARYLCGEPKCEASAPAGGTGSRSVDDLVDEAVGRWGSHADWSRCPAPVEPSTDATKLMGTSETGECLSDGPWRAVEVLGTPEAIVRADHLAPDLSRNARFTHGSHRSGGVGKSLRVVDSPGV
ncbi:MAG: hypothetical protein HYX34_02600 [Actinobacteria bacterium]|nr:hypothetical protein [Actinomycetota bacterium]